MYISIFFSVPSQCAPSFTFLSVFLGVPYIGHKDDRKGISETRVARKSNGILVAVSPCLQIMAIRPMYASESVTQVVLLVQHLLTLFTALAFIIYDNACGAARTVRKRVRDGGLPVAVQQAWQRLAALNWVVDRLHLRYHSACRQPSSPWFVPAVDPAAHPDLHGIDTEAAEQVFHIASRWQIVLSYAAPTHQELFLLLFAREHNVRHSCAKAWTTYCQAQLRPSAAPLLAASSSGAHGDGACSVPKPVKKRKRQPTVHCQEEPAASTETLAQPSEKQKSDAELQLTSASPDDQVVVNQNSSTVHAISDISTVETRCGWRFDATGQRPQRAKVLKDATLFCCGSCFAARVPFLRPRP